MTAYVRKGELLPLLEEKSKWVWKETLKIHKLAPETRIASSLSPIEMLVTLFHGGIIKHDPKNVKWEGRDRFIISKGHGTISFYPILADLGFFDMSELGRVGAKESFLGGIPDCVIPGYETTNGSLGHGVGVACGISLALRKKGGPQDVVVMVGDGELYEGAVWEAVMFAGAHGLDNLTVILDSNKICMLGYCKDVIDLEPIEEKFKVFKWQTTSVDGHDIGALYDTLASVKSDRNGKPKLIVANTIKGRGVPSLETDSLCHIRSLKPEQVDELIAGSK